MRDRERLFPRGRGEGPVQKDRGRGPEGSRQGPGTGAGAHAGPAGAGGRPRSRGSREGHGRHRRSVGPGRAAAPASRPPARDGGSASLFDTLLGVTPAYAQDGVASPEVTSPAIRRIIESRAARVAAIDKYKGSGVIGENNKALLEIRSLEAITDLKSRAEAQRLVKAENSDREELFKEIAVAKKVEASQIPKIQETYAQTIRERAHAGEWIQMPDGAWKQK